MGLDTFVPNRFACGHFNRVPVLNSGFKYHIFINAAAFLIINKNIRDDFMAEARKKAYVAGKKLFEKASCGDKIKELIKKGEKLRNKNNFPA